MIRLMVQGEAINTPEKRACWRVGHETQKGGGFDLHHDINCERTATEAGSVTGGNDDYYRCLVQLTRRAWER